MPLRLLPLLAISIAIIFFLLSIVGAYLSYSSVPFWDMFDGYLKFYLDVLGGDFSAWWSQHNEHRIVLSKLFFWLDLKYFSGSMILLYVVNYVTILLMAICYIGIIFEKYGSKAQADLRLALSVLVVIFLYSWVQYENLTWGFQTQFFLAQLLPLAAFYMLYKASISKSITIFIFSLLVGFCSLGTMANGVLVLPLMILLSFFLGDGFKKITIVTLFTVLSIILYFYGYESPKEHSSIRDVVFSQPIELIQYIILYMGAPFKLLFNGDTYVTAYFFGIVFFFFLAYKFLLILKDRLNGNRINDVNYVLLAMCAYVSVTSFATATGRVVFGIEQAFSSRYTTPVLVAWCALVILIFPKTFRIKEQHKKWLWVTVILIQLSLIPYQQRALDREPRKYFDRSLAVLALDLGVEDHFQIKMIYPVVKWAQTVASESIDAGISIFSDLQDLASIKKVKEADRVLCPGALDGYALTPNESEFYKLRGWFFDGASHQKLQVINDLNEIKGIVLTGAPRKDVMVAVGEDAYLSGFEGYVQIPTEHENLKIVSERCFLPIHISGLPFSINNVDFDKLHSVITSSSIKENVNFNGSDYFKSESQYYEVYGSYVQSDADLGSISFSLPPSGSFLYRSGPSNTGLTITIAETTYTLPVSLEWSLITLDSAQVDEAVVINIEDNGQDWGQWSAIALLKNEEYK